MSDGRKKDCIDSFDQGRGNTKIQEDAARWVADWARRWLAGELGKDPKPVWDNPSPGRGKKPYGVMFRANFRMIGQLAALRALRRRELRSAGAAVESSGEILPSDVEEAAGEVTAGSACPFCPNDP